MNETEALLALNAVEGLGPARIKKLLDRFKLPSKILSLKESELTESQILPAVVVTNFLKFSYEEYLKKEINLCVQEGINVLSWMDPEYPQVLKNIDDAPVILYVKGKINFNDSMMVAMVGSRKASIYGQMVARKFAGELAELGFTIVSGLARGIDTCAHHGALKAQGNTIAVLGSGLKHIYPEENQDLAGAIANQGAIVSEFSMSTLPISYNFPRRNRIISGLSMGTIVVEASEKSGALITAYSALEQGKEVFAVPGKIDNPCAFGTNALIKQGAVLVTCVEDILENLKAPIKAKILHPQLLEENVSIKNNIEKLTENQQLVYNHINCEPIYVDSLNEKVNLDVSELANVLFVLEVKKLINQLPGKMFVRKG